MKHYGYNFEILYSLPLSLLYDICQFIREDDTAIAPDYDVLIRGCIVPFLRNTVKAPKGTEKDEVMRLALIMTAKTLGVNFDNWDNIETDTIATAVRRHVQQLVGEKLESLSKEEREQILKQARDNMKESAVLVGLPVAAMGAMTAGELSGFGIYLATTTGLKALSLALGTTFSWATYQSATTLLGVVLGPIGWTLAGLSLAGGVTAAIHKWIKGKSERKLALVVITLELAIGESPFEFFDLPQESSFEDGKKRYRAMMKTFHPDKLEKDLPQWVYEDFTEKLLRCQEAYERLKSIYDKGEEDE